MQIRYISEKLISLVLIYGSWDDPMRLCYWLNQVIDTSTTIAEQLEFLIILYFNIISDVIP
jgi:hypothetical protein